MKTKWPLLVGLAVFLVMGWAMFEWYRSREIALSEVPTRSSSSAVLDPRDSVVLVNLGIDYPVLEAALNEAAGRLAGNDSDSQDIKCISNDFPRFRECLTVNWSVSYNLNGRITVARDGDKIKVTVPARFAGRAGFGGQIASLISLNAKNFDGAFTISASAALKLDNHFCPVVVPGDVSFGWQNEGRIELVGRSSFKILGIGFDVGPWHLDIGRHFNGQIRDALRAALADSGKAIPCGSVHAELKKAWRKYSIPVSIENVPPLFVNIDPTALGTSGLLVEDAGIRVIGRMAAKVLLTPGKGSEDAKGDLPPNEPAAPGPGLLKISIPLKAPYALLQTEATKALGQKPITLRTPGGEVTLTFHGVDVFPTGNKIAVGVRFSADLPRRLFDAKGAIWVTARPIVEPSGRVVRLDEVAVTRQIDNPLWAILTVALKDTINQKVQAAARYDLEPAISNAVSGIKAAIADPSRTGNVRFRMSDINIGLGQIVTEEQALAVEGLLDAQWDASLETIKP